MTPEDEAGVVGPTPAPFNFDELEALQDSWPHGYPPSRWTRQRLLVHKLARGHLPRPYRRRDPWLVHMDGFGSLGTRERWSIRAVCERCRDPIALHTPSTRSGSYWQHLARGHGVGGELRTGLEWRPHETPAITRALTRPYPGSTT